MNKKDRVCIYLKMNHTGKENAVHSKELERRFKIKARELQRIVSVLRKEGKPICSGQVGYYYAKDQAEINQMILKFNSYSKSFCAVKENMLYSSVSLVRDSLQMEMLFGI